MRRNSTLLATLVLLQAGLAFAQKPEAKPAPATLELSPHKLTLRLGEGKQLQARIKGREGSIRWSLEGQQCGSITPTGYYQAPSTATTPATLRVVATTDGNPPLRAETIVFLQAVSVKVNPSVGAIQAAQTCQLRAEVRETEDQRVRWSVEGGEGNGQITETGLYNSPARFLTPGTVTVRAVSLADPSKGDTATIRIGAISVQARPKEVTLVHGRSYRFEARVAGTPNTAVEWKVLDAGQGEISNTGLYTPPPSMATPAVVTLVASSAADPTKTAISRVRIEPVQIVGGRQARRKKGGLMQTAGLVLRSAVRKVTQIYLPFNPVDAIVKGPFFRGKSGKQYVPLGAGAVLAATVVNTTNDRIRWEIEGQAIGTITGDGFYQAPDSLSTPAVVQIRATSLADPSKTVLQTLHIPPVVVEAERESAGCLLDGAVQLKARVENTENDRVSWSVEGGSRLGVVSETGIFRPAAVLATPTVVRVRAASAADPTKFAVIQVNIPEVGLDLSPETQDVRPGESVRLRVKVKNCANAREVTWKLTPAIGEITPDGVYRAPHAAGEQVVQVTATLKADPTKTAVSRLRLTGR